MTKTFERINGANGSHLQGYVTTTFDALVAAFGEPDGPGDKTTAEWALRFADGTIATVYDWKTWDTPKGQYEWHIGGFTKVAVLKVAEVLGADGIL